MNEECFSQPLASRRLIYSKTAHQRDRHRVTRKILGHYVKSNCAARDRIVPEYPYFTVFYCDISPSDSFAFMLTGISLKISIQFLDTAIKILTVVVRRESFDDDHSR